LGPRHHDGFDGWLRRLTCEPWTETDDRRAGAAILGTQLLISLVFLNAAFYKTYAYGEGLRQFMPWVFSDNLRNVIIRQHVVLGVPLQEPFRFIVTHAFAYRGLALGNMIAQTLPFLACFLMRRPWLRLLCGLTLGSEVVGLGAVMGIWNPHWLLFIFFFFDWDRLVFQCQSQPMESAAHVAAPWPSRLAPHLQLGVFVLLLGFNGHVMFTHLKQQQWTFPITSYPMFSLVVAEAPFNQHLPYYIPVSRFEFDADRPLSTTSLHGNWLYNWGMMWIADTRPVNQQILGKLQAQNNCTIRDMKAYRALLRVPTYPECELHEVIKLLVYHYRDGAFRTVTGLAQYDAGSQKCYIEFRAVGFTSPDLRFRYFTEDGAGPFDLPGHATGNRYYYTRPTSRKIIAAFEITEPGGTPVLFGGPML
jgi:hypothetical protein